MKHWLFAIAKLASISTLAAAPVNPVSDQEQVKIRERFFLPLYLLTLFLIGVGYLAILPIFEGFDENAHYSSLRQIADTGTIPLFGASFLDQEVSSYQGPSPYNSAAAPFDQGLTYKKFLAQPSLRESYIAHYRQSLPTSQFQPGNMPNWQAQHPPLYYALLAPVEKLMESVPSIPLVTRILLLRLASFLLALGGVFFGFLASRDSTLRLRDDPAVVGFVLYPLVLPMFFGEFARIGNDCLCLFLVGLIAFLFSKFLKNEENKRLPLAIGILIGLGLLTKAFFLPIAVAMIVFCLIRQCRLPREQAKQWVNWRNLALILMPAMMIGGCWYFYNFLKSGASIASADFAGVASWSSLLATVVHHFPLSGVEHGIFVTFMSYSWAGTWSLARLPMGLHKPLLWLAAWCFAAFLWPLRRLPLTDKAWLPVFLFFTFGGGLLYHIVVSVIVNGDGNTPGWYLHILMPWFAPALGIGLLTIFKNPKTKWILMALLLYSALFQVMAVWAQFALFTGCAIKGDSQLYVFPDQTYCLNQASILMDRLSILGWPMLAALGFGGGLLCAVLLLVVFRRDSRLSMSH